MTEEPLSEGTEAGREVPERAWVRGRRADIEKEMPAVEKSIVARERAPQICGLLKETCLQRMCDRLAPIRGTRPRDHESDPEKTEVALVTVGRLAS